MTNIEKVNQALRILKKRVKAEKFIGTAEHTDNIEFYRLSNNKMLIVFWDYGIIKSILEQRERNKRYYYQINGQEGTNTKLLYYAEYDYDIHEYKDLLKTA